MQNKNIMTLLVGIVAVVVVIESVILIGNLGKKVQVGQVKLTPDTNMTTKVTPVENASFEMMFSASKGSMVVGKSSTVGIDALAKEAKTLDAISLYVKYDPEVLKISGLMAGDKLPKPNFIKVSEKTGLVVVSYLMTGASGLKVNQGDSLSLAKFEVTPKKEGSYKLEISTGKESKESATMFVESVTNKALPYSSNELNVNVTK